MNRKTYRANSISSVILFLVYLLISFLSFNGVAFSGQWSVSPISLEFDNRVKTNAVTVTNEGANKLHVQLKAYEWTQDSEGKDLYKETKDIIYFPRIMILGPKEKRIVRVGIKMPVTGVEKTYRLYMEEIPGPSVDEGVNVAIAIRFRIPIFVKPVKEEMAGKIESISLSESNLHIGVKNSGNVHFKIESFIIKGAGSDQSEIFSRKLNGWYLLSGKSRNHTTSIPLEICSVMQDIQIEIKTDQLTLRGSKSIERSMCSR